MATVVVLGLFILIGFCYYTTLKFIERKRNEKRIDADRADANP